MIFFPQAIDFAKEQDDEDLWDDLINYSLDKPGIHFILYCFLTAVVSPLQPSFGMSRNGECCVTSRKTLTGPKELR